MKKTFFILIFLFSSLLIYPQKTKATFFYPQVKGDIFWDKVVTYMQLAAKDLDIDLKVLYPKFNHWTEMEKLILGEINSKTKPDYILYIYQGNSGKKILEAAEKAKVYSFIFNTDITKSDKSKEWAVPGKVYKYWIGHIYPNDFEAGYKLGKQLIDEARSKNLKSSDGKFYISALSGSFDSNVALDRETGLKKAVSEYNDVILNPPFYTYWDYNKGVTITENLFNRYPKTNIIWAASDLLSIAAIDTSQKLGKNIITGGIDWSLAGFKEIRNKRINCSVGGHFLEGVISLILIKDHSKGIDISSIKFPMKTSMEIITLDNIDAYEKAFSTENFSKINLKSLSKYYNKSLKNYDLNLLNLIKKTNSIY